MAFFLKIIGPEVRRDIDLIRLIRNQAAHDMNPISFDKTQQIAGRCRSLHFSIKHMAAATNKDERTLFMTVTQFYAANLLLRAADDNAEVAATFKGLAPYLDE
jgi:hypothetical protein